MIKSSIGFVIALTAVACASTPAKPRPQDADAGGAGGGGLLDAANGGAGGITQTLSTGGTGGSGGTISTGCGWLNSPTNGAMSAPISTYGSTATYSCSPGFVLSGSATRACQTDGTWSGDAPTCVATDVVRQPLPGITNGVVSAPVTKYGAIASYYCSSGYSLHGNATRTCQADGMWDGAEPTCVCDVACNGVCTDIEMDATNCGACGIVCPAVPTPSTTQCMLGHCLVTLASAQLIRDIAVDTASVYWTAGGMAANGSTMDQDSLNGVPLGGGPSTTLVGGSNIIANITIDAFSVYWVHFASPMTNPTPYVRSPARSCTCRSCRSRSGRATRAPGTLPRSAPCCWPHRPPRTPRTR
jgi:Sushi repeat (SCR repeat)